MIRATISLAFLLCLPLLTAVHWPRVQLLVNAQILTMNPAQPEADALLLNGQHIVAVGAATDLLELAPANAKIEDLNGATVMPGFVDAHSHFPSAGLVEAGLDLTPPPVGSIGTLSGLLDQVAEQAGSLPAGSWIIGFNYDNAALDVQRHPLRFELDEIAPDHPVYLWHRSGHMGVANSRALQAIQQDNSLPSADSLNEPSGLLQEEAAPRLGRLLSELPVRRLLDAFYSARDEYLAAGVTTLQNGFADKRSMQLLLWAKRLGLLPQRIVLWPAHDKLPVTIKAPLPLSQPVVSASDHPSSSRLSQWLGWPDTDPGSLALSAVKLIADGSPQGRTAWLTEPYISITQSEQSEEEADYRGSAVMPPDELSLWVQQYHAAGFQLAIHGNGDASIDAIIDAVRNAQALFPRTDARHIVVHAQTIRADQLEALAALDVSVSFFPGHTHFWGDWYRNSVLGEARAARISPLATADRVGVDYTMHSDAPVTPISPMQMLWSATERRTLTGLLLGGDEKISRQRALRALTIDAAWQNHLEQDRGSLEAGKLADLIVLSGNPLEVNDVRSIKVTRVWIGGREVYTRAPDTFW